MSRERYVVLGLARARAEWFRRVGQWATSASLPAEFVRCVSVDELRARLRSGRPFSAVLIDGTLPSLDRDVIGEAVVAGVSVIVVDAVEARDWRSLGAAAVLGRGFERSELLEVLAATSEMIGLATLEDRHTALRGPEGRGQLIAVTGPGGTGASTVAIALAQGLAAGEGAPGSRTRRSRDPLPRPSVLLADLCRCADQAMLHDARVVVPSIQELVEAHRTGVPERTQLLDQTFVVPERGYRLLLGLRRPRHWVALRPRALEAALDSLERLADVVVADVDPDIEGGAETGSVDVQERHLLTRSSVARATVVLVVGEPSMKGLFALVRTIGELVGFGVPVARLLPVVNRAPRRPATRAELTSALGELARAGLGVSGSELASPLYLPGRPVDEALRDGVALPSPLPKLVSRAVAAVDARAGSAPIRTDTGPRPVVPGSLSVFTREEPPR